MVKSEIINKIDGLLIYSASLPEKTKVRYISHLERIKEEIAIILSGSTITPAAPGTVPPPKVSVTTSQVKEKKSDEPKKHTLVSVTSNLIPKLTKKGKNKMDDLSTPVNIYTILKLINNRSSIWEIYYLYSYQFKSFFDFLLLIYEIENKKMIDFIKTENYSAANAWIKIGEILIETDLVHEINITNSANYKRKNKGMLIGEAVVELMYLEQDVMDKSLEIQKWLSETAEKAVFIEGVVYIQNKAQKGETVSKNALNILDFIIPTITDTSKVFIPANDPAFASKLAIIDEKSSLLKIFNENKALFKNKTDFFEFILKLDSMELLSYKKNDELEKRDTWVKFGELAVVLDLATVKQIDETFSYRNQNSHRKIYIGEALVEMSYMKPEELELCLKIQRWCNTIIAKISYETTLINAIREVLEVHFKSPTEIGKFKKMIFSKPLQNMICIVYTISGDLNGQVYYIFDRSFAENISKTMMASYGMEMVELDESIFSELCNILTGNSLTKLSKMGVFCETNIPKINMDKEIVMPSTRQLSVLPLMSQNGRCVIGFDLK